MAERHRRAPALPAHRSLSGLACVLGALGLLTAGCGGSPQALPRGAQRIGGPKTLQTRALSLNELGGFLGLGYRLTHDESGSGLRRTENEIQERAGLGASGFVYSPEFLLYEATGVAGISQEWVTDQNSSGYETGEIYEAFGNLRLFPTRWHPTDLFYSRNQAIIPRVFSTRFETISTTARASQSLLFPDGSLRLQALRREIEQRGFSSELTPFTQIDQDTLSADLNYRLTSRQSLGAGYRYQTTDQNPGGVDTEAHGADAEHTWSLDDESRYRIRSRVEGVSQQGDRDQKLLRWTERLDVAITETLDADANGRVERNESNLIDIDIYQADVGLRHRLFESLFTSVRVDGARQRTDGLSTTDTLGSTVNVNYRKLTGLGQLNVSYTNALERRIVENELGGAIDEVHTFPLAPPEEVRLLSNGIDTNSITITDPSGLIFYQEGLDYSLSQDAFGRVTITRDFAGNIPPGGTILVDYVFRTGADFTLDTINHRFRAEHEFVGGVAPYFSWDQRDQEFREIDGTAPLQEVDERSLIGGLEWRQPSFLLGGEYENFESTIRPFDAIRLRAQGNVEVGRPNRLSGGLQQSWIFNRDPDREVSVTQATLQWRTDLQDDLRASVESNLRYEDDSIIGQSLGFSIHGILQYNWRNIRIRLRASHRQTDSDTVDFRSEEVGIWIIREFGSLPRSTSGATTRFLQQ